MRRRWPRVSFWVGLAAVVASSACDTPTEEPPVDPPGGGTGIVAGIDLNALFDDPLSGERQQVERETASRPPSVARVVPVLDIERAEREAVHVFAGLDADGDTAFVGAIRQPPRIPGDQKARPLLLVLPYDANIELAGTLDVPPIRPNLETEFVTVVMAYRGGSLRIEDQTFSSDLTGEPYDRDADDVAALVNYARARAGTDRSDPARLAVVGWGRGGTAALLATVRGLASQLVVTLGAPTDFFLDPVKADARRFLLDQPTSRFPEVDAVLVETIGALRDGTKSRAEVRQALLARSPAYFGPSATYIFATHGALDSRVSVEHGRSLTAVGTLEDVYFEIEEADQTSILRSGQILSTVSNLICQRILPSEPVCGA